MSLPPLTWHNVTEAQWAKIKTEAAEYVKITSDSGSASSNGFTMNWHYDQGSLTIQCTDKPWYLPASVVNDKLSEIVEQCLQ